MVPAALAIVVSAFPVRERGRALALFFGVSGGADRDRADRRRLPDPVDVALDLLDQRAGRRRGARAAGQVASLDAPRRADRLCAGRRSIAVGMGLSVFGFEQAATWGWDSPATWLCIVGGLAVLAVFVVVRDARRVPLIKVRIFRDRAFVVDNARPVAVQHRVRPALLLRQHLLPARRWATTRTRPGSTCWSFFAGFAPAAQVGGRMLDRGGARRPLVIGSALVRGRVRAVGQEDSRLQPGRAVAVHRDGRRRHRTGARARRARTRSTARSTRPTARSPASPRPCATTARASGSRCWARCSR